MKVYVLSEWAMEEPDILGVFSTISQACRSLPCAFVGPFDGRCWERLYVTRHGDVLPEGSFIIQEYELDHPTKLCKKTAGAMRKNSRSNE